MNIQAFEEKVTYLFPALAEEFLAESHSGIRMEVFARFTRLAISSRDTAALTHLFAFAGEALELADLPLRRLLLCHYLTHIHFAGIQPGESLELQALMPENLQRDWTEMNTIIDQVEETEQGGHL
ncbi:MAG: hypothetical protein ACI97B_002061 [Verrucomicrobiales bacterium]|jgi:hypothetical protein